MSWQHPRRRKRKFLAGSIAWRAATQLATLQVAASTTRKTGAAAAVKGPSRQLAKESRVESTARPSDPRPTEATCRLMIARTETAAAVVSGSLVTARPTCPSQWTRIMTPPLHQRSRKQPTLHDPDAATKQGWKVTERQGVGDCFFRCVARSRSVPSSSPQPRRKPKGRGSELRPNSMFRSTWASFLPCLTREKWQCFRHEDAFSV